jgi:hypothetical protein
MALKHVKMVSGMTFNDNPTYVKNNYLKGQIRNYEDQIMKALIAVRDAMRTDKSYPYLPIAERILRDLIPESSEGDFRDIIGGKPEIGTFESNNGSWVSCPTGLAGCTGSSAGIELKTEGKVVRNYD